MTALGVVPGGARAAALALASLTLVAGLVRAEGQRITLGASLSSRYDSNILEYSSAQIALFESGTRPEHYSLETSDDLGWDPGVSLGWELAGPNGRRHALRLSASGNFHQRNGTADFRAASAGWRET